MYMGGMGGGSQREKERQTLSERTSTIKTTLNALGKHKQEAVVRAMI